MQRDLAQRNNLVHSVNLKTNGGSDLIRFVDSFFTKCPWGSTLTL